MALLKLRGGSLDWRKRRIPPIVLLIRWWTFPLPGRLVSGLLALAISAGIQAAHSAEGSAVASAYTPLDLDRCREIQQSPPDAVWRCPGYESIPVWVAEDDLRYFVSFDPHPAEQLAAEQSLPPFTRLGDTLEWRLDMPHQRPFATILRWHTEHDGKPDCEVLVVTRLGADEVCHVAYIDARANPSANMLAWRAADRLASGFDCSNEPLGVGDRSAAVWYLESAMGCVRPDSQALRPDDAEQQGGAATSSSALGQEAEDDTSVLLLSLRTGESYRSLLLSRAPSVPSGQGAEQGADIYPIEGMIVSPQPQGLMRLQTLTVRLPRGCTGEGCRGTSRDVYAARWGQKLIPGNAHQAIRQEMEAAMQGGGTDSRYRRETLVLTVAEGIVCGHTRARWESGAPHPTHIDRRGCVPLTTGRLRPTENPLPPEYLLSEAQLEQARERIKDRYSSGKFEDELSPQALQAVGDLDLSGMRLLLDHQEGALYAFVLADASAPYALSATYDLQVNVPAGLAPQPPAQTGAAAGKSDERTDASARHTFTSPDQALQVVLGAERLRLIDPSSGTVILHRELAWDDVVSAAWISGAQAQRLRQ